MNQNLYALLRAHFPADLSQTAIETSDGGEISYGDLDAGAARMANTLIQHGVQPGDRVMVQAGKSVTAVLLYLGCLRAGGVYLPLNTAYTAAEVDYFMGDAEPTVAVCDPSALGAFEDLAAKHGTAHVLSLDNQGAGTFSQAAEAASAEHETVMREGDDLAAILYTSGTTGRSKGAMLSHANLSTNALALHKIWGFVPGDVLLHALPIFHVHGLFVALHCALLHASRILFLPKFDLDAVLERLPRSSVFMGVPTFYTRLLQAPDFDQAVCANMRLFVSGSAPMLAETFNEFEARSGHTILERYGMTEAGMITSNPYDGERIAATVGYALPDVQTRVADDDGNILPAGEIGVLEIIGPNVFTGYWRMPEKTAEEFRDDGWFVTGDMATMAADGRVAIVGRAKDLIISGGLNVYPKEIESVIDELPGVGEAAVIGLDHPDFGEAVSAVITLDPAGPAISEDDVIAALSDKLAAFKRPKRVFIVDALPRNAMGKVQKKQLRDDYADTFSE